MGLFDLLKPKPVDPTMEIGRAIFPRGEQQFVAEARALRQLLDNRLSEQEVKLLLGSAKSLLSVSEDKSFDRCRDYIIGKSGGKLAGAEARLVYGYLCASLSLPKILPTDG